MGIKCKPSEEPFDMKMLARLGLIYIRRKTWDDAKTVFHQLIKTSKNCAFAWRYLGFALTKLRKFKAAEEALNEAILLDLENPLTWSYMCMFCLEDGMQRISEDKKEEKKIYGEESKVKVEMIDKKRLIQAKECLNEVLSKDYKDEKSIEIFAELANLFLHSGRKEDKEREGVQQNDEAKLVANLYKRILNIDKFNEEAAKRLSVVYELYMPEKCEEAKQYLEDIVNKKKENENDESENAINILQNYIKRCEDKIEEYKNNKDSFHVDDTLSNK